MDEERQRLSDKGHRSINADADLVQKSIDVKTPETEHDDLATFLLKEVTPWLEDVQKSDNGLRGRSAAHKLRRFDVLTDFAKGRTDMAVDKKNPLLVLGKDALAIGIDGSRVAKFSSSYARPDLPQRIFDAEIYERGIIKDKNIDTDPIGYIIQQRVQPFDDSDPEQIRAAIAFFKGLKSGKYGETYVIGDFAAGMDQFGWVRNSSGNIEFKAVEYSAVVKCDLNASDGLPTSAKELLLSEHDAIVGACEELLKTRSEQKT